MISILDFDGSWELSLVAGGVAILKVFCAYETFILGY